MRRRRTRARTSRYYGPRSIEWKKEVHKDVYGDETLWIGKSGNHEFLIGRQSGSKNPYLITSYLNGRMRDISPAPSLSAAKQIAEKTVAYGERNQLDTTTELLLAGAAVLVVGGIIYYFVTKSSATATATTPATAPAAGAAGAGVLTQAQVSAQFPQTAGLTPDQTAAFLSGDATS
jgi:hypothetical protein